MTKHSGEPDSREALKPSNDTLRITAALASPRNEPTAPSTATVEALIEKRALRSSYLPVELLHDPAWDMLLELFHAELSGRSLVEAILCKAGSVSAASGARWVDALISRRLCVRSIDPANPARVFVKLSAEGRKAMCAYFADVAQRPGAFP